MGWLVSYWQWVGGNIGAMPLEALLAADASVVFRKHLRRFLAWLQREGGEEWREALAEVQAARRIAADLFERHTGEQHPAAPESEGK